MDKRGVNTVRVYHAIVVEKRFVPMQQLIDYLQVKADRTVRNYIADINVFLLELSKEIKMKGGYYRVEDI